MNRSKYPEQKKTVRIHIVASYEDAKEYKAKAKAARMSFSAWVRRLMDHAPMEARE